MSTVIEVEGLVRDFGHVRAVDGLLIKVGVQTFGRERLLARL